MLSQVRNWISWLTLTPQERHTVHISLHLTHTKHYTHTTQTHNTHTQSHTHTHTQKHSLVCVVSWLEDILSFGTCQGCEGVRAIRMKKFYWDYVAWRWAECDQQSHHERQQVSVQTQRQERVQGQDSGTRGLYVFPLTHHHNNNNTNNNNNSYEIQLNNLYVYPKTRSAFQIWNRTRSCVRRESCRRWGDVSTISSWMISLQIPRGVKNGDVEEWDRESSDQNKAVKRRRIDFGNQKAKERLVVEKVSC